MDAAKIGDRKGLVVISLFITSIQVDRGLFPIVDLDPDDPVDPGMMMRLTIAATAVTSHKTIGLWEAAVFSKWPMTFTGIFKAALALSGSGCRYLLEFGEASNTYDFTAVNVAIQVSALASVSTHCACIGQKKVLSGP